MKLFHRLFARKHGHITCLTPEFRPVSLVDIDFTSQSFIQTGEGFTNLRYVSPSKPVCRDELLPPEHLGCSLEWEGRCLSSLPCKYKDLCADAPITEQEVLL